jgi:Domain of unknown function (DUF4129)
MPPRAVRAWPALILLAMLPWGLTLAQNTLPDSASPDPQSVIRNCSGRIDGRPTGLSELETQCPQLLAALAQAQIRPLIIDSSRARLDRYSLLQLRRMLHSPAGRAPDTAALRPILRALTVAPAAPRSWWRRLWNWLVEHLTPQQNGSDPWLVALLRSALRVQWLWTVIIWGTLIALPVTIGIVIWREVRALGRRSQDDRAESDAAAATGPSLSRLALLRSAPLPQRPALLFALLIGRLVAAQRLPPDRSLTHREVARKALLDDGEQRRLIESLARLSERQLYADAPGTPEGLAELLAQAEDLYTTGWGRPTGRQQ